MDILRKELNEIYSAQRLDLEHLPADDLMRIRDMASVVAAVGKGCAVITDASCDHCYIYADDFGRLMGFTDSSFIESDSSDEDMIYNRIHPEDLVDKRFLEYEFFKHVDASPDSDKTNCKASCRLRMKDCGGEYRYVDNSTQVIQLSPGGKIWLILCCYSLAPVRNPQHGITPTIVNSHTGQITSLSFDVRRRHVLTERKKTY